MCLCIHNPLGLPIPREVVEDAAKFNSDGYGRMDLTTGRIFRTMDMEEGVREALRPGAAVHHFRFATVGEKTKKGCHPFPIKGNWHLFHNGSIDGFREDGKTDSYKLAKVLSHVPQDKWPAVLESFDSRFLIASKGQQVRVGEWIQQDGIWYSNGYHLDDAEYVAVYGTLKSGHGNHHWIKGGDYFGWGRTSKPHRLCGVDAIPHLIEGDGGKVGMPCVEVEVYKVDGKTLRELDALEGHPHHYERRKIDVDLGDGEVSAWVYFSPEEKDDGSYAPCYGESWTEAFDDDDDDLFCPKCGSDTVIEEGEFMYCDRCLHHTPITRVDEWTFNTVTDNEL